MQGQKLPTIKDIACAAGVSHSTVSRSLNDSPLISEVTKERIRRIAKEMDYSVDSSARSLSTRRTGTVAVIFPELFDHFANSLYMGMLIQDIRRGFDRFSMDSIVTFPRNEYTRESNIERLVSQRKIDGLLVAHPELSRDDWEYIGSGAVPFVVLHFKPRGFDYSGMNYIFTDHLCGGELATEKLIASGCRSILCLTEDSGEAQFRDRTEGYRKALACNNLEYKDSLVKKVPVSFESGWNTVMSMKGQLDCFDGIFAQADIVAVGCIEALKALGLSVPADIPVVGYDDTELGAVFRPGLTTVHQPREEHAALACSRLIDLIRGEKGLPLQVVLQPQLVVRDSCP
jgi:LacI family transcriptional regulator